VEVKIDVGEMAVDFAEVAKREHLDSLSVEVRKLRYKLEDIHQQQEYLRERDDAFRNVMDGTNSWVSWWSFAQVCVHACA
jgi:hypothetical protein